MHTPKFTSAVFAMGIAAGMMLGFGAPAAFASSNSSLAEQIICYVYSNLNTIGSPIPPLDDGSCPAGSTDQVATLTVVKVVDNTGGGTKQVSDFPLFVNGVRITSGTATTTLPGIYTVTETSDSNYQASYSASCPAGVIVLAAGDSKTCTITNTFISQNNGGGDTGGGGGNGGGGGGGQGGGTASSSDLSLTKSADTMTPAPGANVTFTLTLHNAGPDSASNVSVNDTLPTGLTYVSSDGAGSYASMTGIWSVGTVDTTSDAILHIVTAVGSSTTGENITNSASITASSSTDPTATNNTGSVTIMPTASSTDNGGNDNGGGGGGSSGQGGGSSGGGGGGGNGPIIHSSDLGGGGGGNGGGLVLGTSTESGSPCDLYLTDYLRINRPNNPDQVKKLQTFLNDNQKTNLPITGFFGPLTFAAVEKFQSAYDSDVLAPWVPYGLVPHTPTGYVYKTTRREINNLMCSTLNLPVPPLP